MEIVYLLLTGMVAFVVSVLWITLKDFPRVFRSLSKGLRTNGQILRDDEVYSKLRIQHFPVIGFKDERGKLYEVKTRYMRKPSVQEQLRNVEVSYMAVDPQNTAVLVGMRFYLPTLIHVSIALVPFYLFIGFLLVLLSL